MPAADLDREARRAAALRANLRRRKAQARARAETDAPPAPAGEAAADGRPAPDAAIPTPEGTQPPPRE